MRSLLLLLLSLSLWANPPRMIGDSLLAQMKPELSKVGIVKAYSGSGMSNPSIHNWIKDIQATNPEALNVVVLGTNDAQSFAGAALGSQEWQDLYEGRVGEVMVRIPPRRLLWVLPPRVGHAKLDRRLDYVRGIIMKAAVLYGAEVLDARKVLGEDKQFDPRMHSKDRIHLSPRGVKVLSEAIRDWVTLR